MNRTPEERLVALETEMRDVKLQLAALTVAIQALTASLASKAQDGAVHAAACDNDRLDLRGDVARLEAEVKANTKSRLVMSGATLLSGGGVGAMLMKLFGGG